MVASYRTRKMNFTPFGVETEIITILTIKYFVKQFLLTMDMFYQADGFYRKSLKVASTLMALASPRLIFDAVLQYRPHCTDQE